MTLQKKVLLITSFLLFQWLSVNAQTKNYDILVDNINVGSLTASKQIDGDKTIYTIDSKSVVHLLGQKTITTSFVGVFRNGVLESSSYTLEKNGNPSDSSVITESNGVYSISRKGKKTTLSSPIKYVTCLLYFEKPDVSQKYFDVLKAVYSPIINAGRNTYVYADSSSNETTTYTYTNNTLEQGITKYTFYNYTFRLKK